MTIREKREMERNEWKEGRKEGMGLGMTKRGNEREREWKMGLSFVGVS